MDAPRTEAGRALVTKTYGGRSRLKDEYDALVRSIIAIEAEARADALREAADRVRAVPAVPIVNTDYVPRFKRRADQCVDRFAILRAVLDQPPVVDPESQP